MDHAFSEGRRLALLPEFAQAPIGCKGAASI